MRFFYLFLKGGEVTEKNQVNSTQPLLIMTVLWRRVGGIARNQRENNLVRKFDILIHWFSDKTTAQIWTSNKGAEKAMYQARKKNQKKKKQKKETPPSPKQKKKPYKNITLWLKIADI